MAATPIEPTDNMPQTRVKINNYLDELEARIVEAETTLNTAGFVNVAATQTITGAKTFAAPITVDTSTGQIIKGDTNGFMGVSAGTTTNDGGANIALWGATGSEPDTGRLRVDGTTYLQWSPATGITLGSAGTGTTSAVRADRTITAGNGLTGGGNLTADRTVTLGTPGTLTTSTSNSVTTTSHTHAITASDAFLPSLTAGTIAAGINTRLSMEFSNSAGGGPDVVRTVHFVVNRPGTIRVYAQHRRTGNATANHTLTFYKGKSSIGTWTMNSTTLTTRSVDTTVVNGDLITIELVQDVPSSGTYGVEAINCSLRAAQSSLRVPAYYASPSDDPTEVSL